MTTFYLDYEGGNDANDGLSFANRWKTFTNGATAARIAPGDTIRVMASPEPTSIGNATWTSGPRSAQASITVASNTTPIVITTTAAHGFVAGDYVSISAVATNTNANGVWKVGTVPTSTTFQILKIDGTNTTGNGAGVNGGALKANSAILKLPTPLTQNIALCGGLGQKPAWTASANVTATQDVTNYKEGYSAASIAIAAGFTTGLAAYYTLPAALNLSSYQQVSFWIRQSAGTLGAAGAVYVALCSDTVGATVVNTINVPVIGALNTWHQVVVDTGAALGASIQSVAFYVVTDNGAQTFQIDNIVAAKAPSSADSLTHASLVSKNTGDEAWFPIQSINYDVVMLANDNATTSTSTSVRGYYGTSGTVTTYKREAIKQPPAAVSTNVTNLINDSGVAGSLIAYSGGWNRTDMSTQTGETWYDGTNGSGVAYGPATTTQSYNSFDKLNAVRFATGWRFISANTVYNECLSMRVTGCSTGVQAANFPTLTGPIWANNNGTGVSISGTGPLIGTIKQASNNAISGLAFSNLATSGASVALVQAAHNNNLYAIDFSVAYSCYVGSAVCEGNGYAFNVTTGTGCLVGGGSSSGNISGCVQSTGGSLLLSNFTINETTEVVVSAASSIVYSNRHDNTDNNSWVFQAYGTVNQQTSVVDSPAATAWKLSPTSATATARTPIKLKLGTVVVGAGTLVTVTARMRRDNTGLTMQLVCPGGQISGVSADVETDMTAAANTWETVTITFTPTKAGGVDIYTYAFGGTTYSGYVCNLAVSQA